MMDKIIFEPITPQDFPQLTDIMTRAFDEDTALHTADEDGGPNGYDDGRLISLLYNKQGYENYKVYFHGELVGAFTVAPVTEGTYCLEMMYLDPALRGHQLGTQVWQKIITHYPDAIKWTTETPNYSKRNISFYTQKCGFTIVGKRLHEGGAFSYLFEKDITP